MLKYLIIALFAITPAYAQQQQSIPTVAETAIQINGIIGTWAQTLMQQAKQIEQLQKENSELKKQVEDRKNVH